MTVQINPSPAALKSLINANELREVLTILVLLDTWRTVFPH